MTTNTKDGGVPVTDPTAPALDETALAALVAKYARSESGAYSLWWPGETEADINGLAAALRSAWAALADARDAHAKAFKEWGGAEIELDEARAALARAEETAAEARRAVAEEIALIGELWARDTIDQRAAPAYEAMAEVARIIGAREPKALVAAAPAARDGGDCTAKVHGPACNGIHYAAAAPAAPADIEYIDVQWGVRHANGHSVARSEGEAREWVAEATGPVTLIRRTVTRGAWRDAATPPASEPEVKP